MDNPYQSPLSADNPFAPATPGYFYRPRGMMGQIRVVAILMIIQGALELMMGIGLIGILCLLSLALKEVKHADAPPYSPAWVLVPVYGTLAAAGFISAVLHIWAGIVNLRFRHRTFGIVALSCGCLSVFTLYCSLTTIPLAIYGLIVYLNASSTEAFRLGESGYNSDQIYTAFQ
jgi:hypothetical protein